MTAPVFGTLVAFDVDLPDVTIRGSDGLAWEVPAGRYELRRRPTLNPGEYELILADGTPVTVGAAIGDDGRVEIS
jgi:hypothetical protein